MSRVRYMQGRYPWKSVSTGNDAVFRPVSIPNTQGVEWYWRVKEWTLSWNLIVSNPAPNPPNVGSMTISWNAKNNADKPLSPGTGPVDEQDLPIGWQMQSAGTFVLVDFFRSYAGGTGTGDGIGWDLLANPCAPNMQFSFSHCVSAASAPPGFSASAVTATIDGVTVLMFEDTTLETDTGTINMSPSAWWPDELAAGGNPIWDATTGASILPSHQTDELPSMS